MLSSDHVPAICVSLVGLDLRLQIGESVPRHFFNHEEKLVNITVTGKAECNDNDVLIVIVNGNEVL